MNTQKASTNRAQSSAASHAAVIHRHIPSAADRPAGPLGARRNTNGHRWRMKKPFLHVISLLVAMLACAKSATTVPILPEEAKDHVGEDVRVRGLVEQVSFSRKGHAFLNFGEWYPRRVFTGSVRADDVERVGGLSTISRGKSCDHQGRIELFKGRPEIVITSPNQIEK